MSTYTAMFGRAAGAPLMVGAVVSASVPGALLIHVHRGDTLTAIARQHHTTVPVLVALNRLPGNGDLILAGQTLRVPGSAPAGRSDAWPTARPADGGPYAVRPGDTAGAIARTHHTTLTWLRAHNRLDQRWTIYVGQRLTLPEAARTTTRPAARARHGGETFAGRTYPPAVLAAARRHRLALARARVPSRSTVRRLIVATARRFSVDPALALALAEQESGFQQRAVSPADAVGTMQVLPATGTFVARYVIRRPLDLLRAHDNITAGVALLGQLTRAAPVDQAVAGYYQGLGSVRKNGMYADTKAYVRNVLALRRHYSAHSAHTGHR